MTWGLPQFGGDSSGVQAKLRCVQQIQATERAFAAILEDGSVVTWGDPEFGGDSSAVEAQLKSAQQIQATERAFAAILADGSILSWGFFAGFFGDDISAVQAKLLSARADSGRTERIRCHFGRWISGFLGPSSRSPSSA